MPPKQAKWSELRQPNVYSRYRYRCSSDTDTDTDAATADRCRQTDRQTGRQTERQGDTQCRPTLSTNKLIFLFVFVFNCNERSEVLKSLCATFKGRGRQQGEGTHTESCPFISQAAHTHTPAIHTIINAIKYFSSETHKFPKAYGDVKPDDGDKEADDATDSDCDSDNVEPAPIPILMHWLPCE